ncbi:DUF4974 domain-containing protein [Marinilabiliaceae bacterium ANBcel2]|nr:DUF4974 domain-containing protein [Marinilabiliaceae bacterium ANBcel2]
MTNLLRKYLEGTCTFQEKEIVEKELKAGSPSNEVLDFLKRYWHDIDEKSSITDLDIDFDKVLDRVHHSINLIDDRDSSQPLILRNLFFTYLKIAATILVLLMVSGGIWYAGFFGIFQEEKFYTLSSVRGQSSNLVLPDDTRVWLSGESSLNYSSKYGIDNRTIYLDGGGYFNVGVDSDVPFIVEVDGIEITALGTSFNIDFCRDEEIVSVTLETGRVRVQKGDSGVDLEPGDQANIHGNNIDVTVVDTELYTSWHQGRILFKNEPLEFITNYLETLYDVEFVYNSESLKDTRYRGAINIDQSILKVVEMLQISAGISYEVAGNKIILDY